MMSDLDPSSFRNVLGHFPTGVTVITAIQGGVPTGMAVSSFSSVSLDPPLVGFYAAVSSSSWAVIEQADGFCVNILAVDQERVSRQFASSGADKFAGLCWSAGATGAPQLDGALAWIDCRLHAVHPAGDHVAVLGRVTDLHAGEDADGPLLYYRGGYGRLAG